MKLKLTSIILMATLAISLAEPPEEGFSGPTEESIARSEQEPTLTRYEKVTEAMIRSLQLTGQDAEDFRLLREEMINPTIE